MRWSFFEFWELGVGVGVGELGLEFVGMGCIVSVGWS